MPSSYWALVVDGNNQLTEAMGRYKRLVPLLLFTLQLASQFGWRRMQLMIEHCGTPACLDILLFRAFVCFRHEIQYILYNCASVFLSVFLL